MSLSNLQHYFKSKEALLIGLIDFYLTGCADGLERSLAGVEAKGPARFRAILAASLDSAEMAPLCSVFKEIWAIAERNPVIQAHLIGYYRMYVGFVSDELRAIAPDCPSERIAQAVSLIVPLVEGYAVTREALPLDATAMTDLLASQVLALIAEPG